MRALCSENASPQDPAEVENPCKKSGYSYTILRVCSLCATQASSAKGCYWTPLTKFWVGKLNSWTCPRPMSTAGNIKLFKTINQIFHYICCITPKRVARSEFVKFISASLRPGNTASFEEMSQRWRAVGNIVQFDRPDI